ncbi:serine hydrolase domain-containing protein [Jiangella asiatica]|uniref:Class A beta-lactamase-related serine hydrolase n=1 Tax=Jiangella asiatica TaxID=2530372 RepID=A0A4R5CUU0_9ACTN|nr:serine hydrolase domain-containing protein [Jiangella asiatica]TDE03417.1 class A beta-lactamase-related serine hydrolase [Jiangella asiatica]
MTDTTDASPLPERRPSRRAVLGVAATALSATAAVSTATVVPAHAGGGGSVPKDLRPGGALDRFLAQRAADDEFSGTVRLCHRGRAVLTRSYGMANKETGVPNRTSTRFDLASMTKSFTAVAVAQLVQRKIVRLDDTVGAYLDGFAPAVADAVTVHHLLTHTSGFGRPPTQGGPPPPPAPDGVEETWDARMDILRALDRTDLPPGSTFQYSNDGFFLLGAIVAAASGRPFHDYVRENVFEPAKLRDTDFYTQPEIHADDRIARLYRRTNDGWVDYTTEDHFRYIGGPDEGASSTVADLLTFSQALTDGETLLDPPYANLITGPKTPTPEKPELPTDQGFYGYGHGCAIVNGDRVYGHSGSGPGRAVNLDVFPDLDWVAIVLGNYQVSIDPVVALARDLITTSP